MTASRQVERRRRVARRGDMTEMGHTRRSLPRYLTISRAHIVITGVCCSQLTHWPWRSRVLQPSGHNTLISLSEILKTENHLKLYRIHKCHGQIIDDLLKALLSLYHSHLNAVCNPELSVWSFPCDVMMLKWHLERDWDQTRRAARPWSRAQPRPGPGPDQGCWP